MKQAITQSLEQTANELNVIPGGWRLRPLSQLDPGECGTLHIIDGQDSPEFSLCPALGLRTGKNISVVARSIAGGPVLIEVDARTIAVDRALARNIQLCLGE